MNKNNIQNIIYSSGDVFLPEKVKKILERDLIGNTKKTFYVSNWSIVHLINGIIVGFIYLYFKWDSRLYTLKLFIIHTIWELWQMLIGMSNPLKLTGRSNLIDTIMDTIFFMIGAYIIRIFFKSTTK
jgi:hypothetical protein